MQLKWIEVSTAAPNWGLANSRTAGPETTRGGGIAAVVQRSMQVVNSAAIKSRIESRKRELMPRLEKIFRKHARGGVLVVACIEIRQVGEMQGRNFRYMHEVWGVYARPEHAIGRWRRQPRLEAAASGSQLTYRFFWVTRQ